MTDPTAIEQTIVKFLADFMDVHVSSRDDSLTYLLTSIQQYELLVFIESEFGVALPPVKAEDGTYGTVARLAGAIAEARQSGAAAT